MFRRFLFSLLITGLSCALHEYDESVCDEYLRLEKENRQTFTPQISLPNYNELPKNSKIIHGDQATIVQRPLTIIRDGQTGLHFTITDSSSPGCYSYLCKEGTLFATWFKFEFEPEETLLTIRFGNTKRGKIGKNVDLIASVYFSRNADRLEQTDGVCAGFLDYSEPATVKEIANIIKQDNRKEKTALLCLDWIRCLFLNEVPRQLEDLSDDESCTGKDNRKIGDETVVRYLLRPIVMNTEVLEKLLELKDHMEE